MSFLCRSMQVTKKYFKHVFQATMKLLCLCNIYLALISLLSGALQDSKCEYLEHSSQFFKFLHSRRKLYIVQLIPIVWELWLFIFLQWGDRSCCWEVLVMGLMRGFGDRIDTVDQNSMVVKAFSLLGRYGWLELSDYWDWLLC